MTNIRRFNQLAAYEPEDIDYNNSTFTDWTGDTQDIFLSPFSSPSLVNSTATNPKVIIIAFNRTGNALQLGLGENNGGDFSNVKISLLGSGGATRAIYDESTDNTKRTSLNAQFEGELFNSLKIEFLTADTVSLSNITIQKASNVTAQLQGQDPNEDIKNVQVTGDGYLAVSNNSDGLAIAEGQVTGKSFVHKFGSAPDFDISDGFVDVWDGANDAGIDAMNYTYSTTADIDTISSSSASDTVDIEVQGLDTNYALTVQTATLNGTNKVTLTTPLIRVFRLKNVGSSDLVGNCYCYVDGTITGGVPDTAADVRAIINNGNNQTLMAIYTIPAGKTGYLRELYAAGANATGGLFGASGASDIRLFVRPFGQVFQLKFESVIAGEGSSILEKKYVEPEVINEKSDIAIRCNTSVDGSGIAAGFDIVLVDD